MSTTKDSPSKGFYWCFYNTQFRLITADPLKPTEFRELPYFDRSLKPVLDTLGIFYFLNGNQCVIWDPTCEEYEDFTAFIKRAPFSPHGSYIVTDEVFTGLIPTKEMFEKAKIYYETARKRINEFLEKRDKLNFEQEFQNESLDGICYCVTQSYNNFVDLPSLLEKDYYVFSYGREVNEKYTGGIWKYLVIRKSAITSTDSISLKVPVSWAGKIIGKEGKNIKNLVTQLGVRHISVIPIPVSPTFEG